MLYEYLRSWGSRLKCLFNLYHFIGIKDTLRLFTYWLIKALFYPTKGIVDYDREVIYYINKWLTNKYDYLIPESFENETKDDLISESNEPIWVLWYQGANAMPEIVRLCYSSICKQSNGHPVNLLTKDNIKQYAKLPDYVYDKVEKGLISYTHLSDILRINLLYNYGGLWMDSTLFITAPIQMKSFNNLFYSIKNKPIIKGTISDYRWATFCLYCRKDSPVFKVISDLFLVYLKENNSMIDYFLIDYFYDMLYRKNQTFKNEIDSISYSNPNLHLLISELNKPFNDETLNQYLLNTSIFKFNYRPHFVKEINDKLSLYGYLIINYLNK